MDFPGSVRRGKRCGEFGWESGARHLALICCTIAGFDLYSCEKEQADSHTLSEQSSAFPVGPILSLLIQVLKRTEDFFTGQDPRRIVVLPAT